MRPRAYVHDGAIYCPDCGAPADAPRDEVGVSFDADDCVGHTCDSCAACCVDGAGWIASGEATDRAMVRWSTCMDCNAQTPYWRGGADYKDARRATLTGKARCRKCGKSGTDRFLREGS